MTEAVTHTLTVGDCVIEIETGAIARQAGGAAIISSGDTKLLAVATADRRPTRLDYMPLTTEFRVRYSAAGRIPGNYDRREARPSEPETLTSRLIDRSIRPFFPDGWASDTQVMVQPLSYDPDTDPAVLGITAAAAALMLSDIPWQGPVTALRIGRIDGALVVFPSPAQLAKGDLDLVVTVGRDGIVMVEGGASEVAEDDILAAFDLVRQTAGPLLDVLDELGRSSRPKRAVPTPAADGLDALRQQVAEVGEPLLRAALAENDKGRRYDALDAARTTIVTQLTAGDEAISESAVRDCIDSLKKSLIRAEILADRRIGGRDSKTIREITGRAGWLKRCHGSSLFTRGETQAIVTCTLGRGQDAKQTETLDGMTSDRFLLHYNFPPYSVGEVKPLRGPGRREIGHGALARRALVPVLPAESDLPYTIRIESLITESNGSSSMATVCGGSLAMLDAGISLSRPVAGIAMGLVKEGDQIMVLSDILGDEDHVGDMDFKVCGTEAGVTAIQLDNKLGALPDEVMKQALMQARDGRRHILAKMAEIASEPRADMSPHAPRVETLTIETNRIGALVGSGGKTIKGLQSELGVNIDVDQKGLVSIFGTGSDAVRQARERVIDLTGVPKVGETYEGTVVSVQPFGSFIRLFEGVDGLLSGESLEPNQRVKVKVTGVNNRGKLVLQKA